MTNEPPGLVGRGDEEVISTFHRVIDRVVRQ